MDIKKYDLWYETVRKNGDNFHVQYKWRKPQPNSLWESKLFEWHEKDRDVEKTCQLLSDTKRRKRHQKNAYMYPDIIFVP